MVLIVEPNLKSLNQICELMNWADGRCKLVTATDAASALQAVESRNPTLLICNPVLPDLPGSELCVQIRKRAGASVYVAYTNEPAQNLARIFDLTLPNPPTKLSVLQCVQQARTIRRSLKKMRHEIRETAERKRVRYASPSVSAGNITVNVAVNSNADELVFAVPVTNGSTVAELFRQLGKTDVKDFSIVRGCLTMPGRATDELQHNDKVLLGVKQKPREQDRHEVPEVLVRSAAVVEA